MTSVVVLNYITYKETSWKKKNSLLRCDSFTSSLYNFFLTGRPGEHHRRERCHGNSWSCHLGEKWDQDGGTQVYICIKCIIHPRLHLHTYPATDIYRCDRFQLVFSSRIHHCSCSLFAIPICSPSVSQRECQDLAEFVRQVLGPYSVNVTTAARLCSASLCQGKGRCIRQNPESSAYLHLPPPSEVVEKVTEKVRECCCFLK